MGTDLFTSARGPGLIGMILALIVLGGFSLLPMFAFDEGEKSGQSMDYLIKQNVKRIDQLEKSITTSEKRVVEAQEFKKTVGEITDTELRLQSAKNLSAELETKVADAQQRVVDAQQSITDYKQQYREYARGTLVGKEFETLTTQEGKVYQKVKVTEIDPARMQIRHSSGITGVSLVDLPDELLELLQLDAEETEQHLVAEKERSTHYNQRADLADQQMKIAKLEEHLRVLTNDLEKAKQLIAKNTAAIDSYRNRIDAKQAELAADRLRSRSGGVSKAPQIEGHIHNLNVQLRKTEQSISTLTNSINTKSREVQKTRVAIAEAKKELQKKANRANTESNGE